MKIKEAESRTGIIVKNIQFYEKEGLLMPARNPKNGYREYEEKDIQRLEQIKILRMLDMPIADIRRCLNNECTLTDKLTERVQELEQEEERINSAKNLCTIFIEEEKTIEELGNAAMQQAENSLKDYHQRLAKIRKKDRQQRLIWKSKYIALALLIIVLGLIGGYVMLDILMEASVYPIVVIVIFILVAGVTGAAVIQNLILNKN